MNKEEQEKGLITYEQARELLNLPLREGETLAGRVEFITQLLNPTEEECPCCGEVK